MIRLLTIGELPILLPGAELYAKEGQLSGGFSSQRFMRSWTRLLRDDIGTIFGYFGKDGEIQGALGATISEPLHSSHKAAVEVFWYVLPTARKGGLGKGIAMRLFKAFERWAGVMGAQRIVTCNRLCLQSEALSRIYRKLGYQAFETYYALELTGE